MTNLAKAIVILFLSLSVIIILFWKRDYTKEVLRLDTRISGVIKKKGIDDKSLVYEKREKYKTGRYSFLEIEKRYEVGTAFNAGELLDAIGNSVKKTRFKLAQSVFEKNGENETFLISLSIRDRVIYKIKFLKKRFYQPAGLKPVGAKIAIVLDDFGYNMNNIDSLLKIKSPLTISILPNLPYSEKVARQLAGHNIEIILHLPLEPHDEELNLEEGTIMVQMPPQKVNEMLAKAIVSIPGLKGVSNHMGSKATEDCNFMKGLLKELKKRDLYFLDNLVTDKSVCAEVAEEVGLRTTSRSIFLDNESDESYIEKQIYNTANLAAKTGWAIAVGHDRVNTIRVLVKIMPKLEKAGFKFVHVSELVK